MRYHVRVCRIRTGISFTVSPSDRRRLEALVRDRNTPQKHVWRAEIVLFSDWGLGTVEIMRRTAKSKTSVWRWQERFAAEGISGLLRDKTRPSRIAPLAGEIADRVVALTLALLQKPVSRRSNDFRRFDHGGEPAQVLAFSSAVSHLGGSIASHSKFLQQSRAGANARISLGTTVVGGMLVATILSLVIIPVAYVIVESARDRMGQSDAGASERQPAE